VKVVPGATIIIRMCDGCGSLQKRGDVVATSQWRCIESVIHHEQDVHGEQHTNICGANKQ